MMINPVSSQVNAKKKLAQDRQGGRGPAFMGNRIQEKQEKWEEFVVFLESGFGWGATSFFCTGFTGFPGFIRIKVINQRLLAVGNR